MGGLCPVPQPFVVAFSMRLWIRYNGIAILNADGIIDPPDCAGAATKVSEFPVAVHIDRVPKDSYMKAVLWLIRFLDILLCFWLCYFLAVYKRIVGYDDRYRKVNNIQLSYFFCWNANL